MFSLRRIFDACCAVMGVCYLVFFTLTGYTDGSEAWVNGAYAFGSIGFAALFLFIGGKCHDRA